MQYPFIERNYGAPINSVPKPDIPFNFKKIAFWGIPIALVVGGLIAWRWNYVYYSKKSKTTNQNSKEAAKALPEKKPEVRVMGYTPSWSPYHSIRPEKSPPTVNNSKDPSNT